MKTLVELLPSFFVQSKSQKNEKQVSSSLAIRRFNPGYTLVMAPLGIGEYRKDALAIPICVQIAANGDSKRDCVAGLKPLGLHPASGSDTGSTSVSMATYGSLSCVL